MMHSSRKHSNNVLFFIDSTLSNLATILAGLPPGAEVHLLDPKKDGLTQIATTLQGRHGIDALHIFSHGSIGEVQLGNLLLTSTNLNTHTATLVTIGEALSANGDILLYGCNVGKGTVGQNFIEKLASATHADITASNNLTGATQLGGDWSLEFSSGSIETKAIVLPSYGGILADMTFLGTPGNDSLVGGTGNDTFSGSAGNDTFDGGAGIDMIDYSQSVDAIKIYLNSPTSVSGSQGSDTLLNIENATGSAYNDTIGGSTGDNVLLGGLGDDLLSGNTGNDTVDGGDGNDLLYGNGGNDYIIGGLGDDILIGNAGDDTIDGGPGIDTASYVGSAYPIKVSIVTAGFQSTVNSGQGVDTLYGIENITGSNGNDTITGSGGDNVLSGGSGDDLLSGGVGNDTLDGGDGNDLLYGNGGDDYLLGGVGSDTLIGNAGNDTLDGGTGIDTVAFFNVIVGVKAILSDNRSQLIANPQGWDTLLNIENAIGSDNNDTITGTSGDNVLLGVLGNDLLSGGEGNDTVDGGDGNDLLYGNGGNDYVTGGAGNDTLIANAGNDTLDGGTGIDTVAYLNLVAAVNISLADTNAQLANSAQGWDTLLNIENVTGSSHNDTLTGSSGDNVLFGALGNDLLNGGLGNDTLTGGDGADVFIFDTALNGATNVDRITDFVVGVDKIQLSPSVFSALTGQADLGWGSYLLYNAGTQALSYDADGAGAGAAVLIAQVILSGGGTLGASDFVMPQTPPPL